MNQTFKVKVPKIEILILDPIKSVYSSKQQDYGHGSRHWLRSV